MAACTSTPASKTAGRHKASRTTARTRTQTGASLAEKENSQVVTPHARQAPGSPLGERQLNGHSGASAAVTSADPLLVMGAIMQRIKEMEDELAHEREAKKHLEEQVQDFLRKENEVDVAEEAAEQARWEKKYEELQKTMEKDRQLIADLRKQFPNVDISDFGPNTNNILKTMVAHPKGTAGKDFSIQVSMGLAGSTKKHAKYTAILRSLRDLVLQSRINWELPWAQIPASKKAKLFQVAREHHPVLKRYMNDWATEEIIKHYMKNKRAHHYASGWLEVPAKYDYLKENASKRDPNRSRVSRAKAELAVKKSCKRVRVAKKRGRRMTREEDMDEGDVVQEEEVGHNEADVDMN
ncbi:unnamed protein product [Cyclocybe aegerita]|uniref:Uncharacterized protein n=1 Tax=Cyclocybe aegerita TaxID=1973307 RepID=A0A8S0WPW4_CYCAE|nr:unnamed protein product [Cyclocybe aegerita]